MKFHSRLNLCHSLEKACPNTKIFGAVFYRIYTEKIGLPSGRL